MVENAIGFIRTGCHSHFDVGVGDRVPAMGGASKQKCARQGWVPQFQSGSPSSGLPQFTENRCSLPGPVFRPLSVYTVSNTLDKPELHRLAQSVARAGGHLRVVFIGSTPIGRMPIGHGAKIFCLLHAIEAHAPEDLICLLDAFDILLVGDLQEMVNEYRKIVADRPPTLLFGAEPWCWPTDPPYEAYCPSYKSGENERYRYLNAGAYMGPCGALRSLLEAHRDRLSRHMDDQAFFGTCYVEGDAIMLDHSCRIFQNLIGHDAERDFEWVEAVGRWKNRHTGSYPFVLHGNGPADSRRLLFDVMGERCGV